MEALIIVLVGLMAGMAFLVYKFYRKGTTKRKFRDHSW